MKQRSLLASSLLAIAVVLSNSGAVAFAESWRVPQPNTAPSDGSWVVVNERGGFDLWSSRKSLPSSGATSETHLCRDGLGDGACDFNDPAWNFGGISILPFCETASQENCLEGISATTADGAVVQGKYLRTVEGERWKADPATGLYEATMPALFEIPGVANGGGASTYLASVRTKMTYDRGTRKFVTRSMSANIFGFTTQSSNSVPSRTVETIGADGRTSVSQRHDPNCLFTETKVCGISQDLPKGVAFQVTARIPNEITGWFHGRMTKQDLSISNFSASNKKLALRANPADVARLAVIATRANSSESAQTMLLRRGGHGGYTAFNGNSIKDFWADEGADAFAALNEWRDDVKDTAAGVTTEWNFSTVDTRADNLCLSDKTKVLGIVTTNATIYSGSAPTFVNGQLKYTVGGLHYQPDGKTLNQGTYDLVIRSDVARCLYGFSKAPISATIQVTGEGGESNVATSVVRETSDGWLKLAAYGFNFSSPTISVQLTQAKAPAKKITITCVSVKNKKITKKISAIAPKCPTGYKKK